MKTIILGIGNPILGDDGVGIHIARRLKEKLQNLDSVTIDEAQTGGMNLLDLMRGYDKAILIDAVCLPDSPHGDVKQFSITDVPTVHSCNPHDVSLPEAIELSKQIGDTNIPSEIQIIGVNIKKIPTEFSDSLSPKIESVISKAIDLVYSELRFEST